MRPLRMRALKLLLTAAVILGMAPSTKDRLSFDRDKQGVFVKSGQSGSRLCGALPANQQTTRPDHRWWCLQRAGALRWTAHRLLLCSRAARVMQPALLLCDRTTPTCARARAQPLLSSTRRVPHFAAVLHTMSNGRRAVSALVSCLRIP